MDFSLYWGVQRQDRDTDQVNFAQYGNLYKVVAINIVWYSCFDFRAILGPRYCISKSNRSIRNVILTNSLRCFILETFDPCPPSSSTSDSLSAGPYVDRWEMK